MNVRNFLEDYYEKNPAAKPKNYEKQNRAREILEKIRNNRNASPLKTSEPSKPEISKDYASIPQADDKIKTEQPKNTPFNNNNNKFTVPNDFAATTQYKPLSKDNDAKIIAMPESLKKEQGTVGRIKQIDEELTALDERYKRPSAMEALANNLSLGPTKYGKVTSGATEDEVKRKRNALVSEKIALETHGIAKDNKAAGVLVNVYSNLFKGMGNIETAKQFVSNKIDEKKYGKDNYRANQAVDTNSPWFLATHMENATRESLLDGTDGIGRFLGDTGLSVVQFLSLAPLNALSLPIMSTGAAAQTAKEVVERGGTTDQAMLQGTISGLVEYFTEKLPLDNLFKIAETSGKIGIKQTLGNIFK